MEQNIHPFLSNLMRLNNRDFHLEIHEADYHTKLSIIEAREPGTRVYEMATVLYVVGKRFVKIYYSKSTKWDNKVLQKETKKIVRNKVLQIIRIHLHKEYGL